MDTGTVRVLLVGESEGQFSPLVAHLRACGCECQVVSSPLNGAGLVLSGASFDLVLCSVEMRDCQGLIAAVLGSSTDLFRYLPVEDGCWWVPTVHQGTLCAGAPALRAGEFVKVLDTLTLCGKVVSAPRRREGARAIGEEKMVDEQQDKPREKHPMNVTIREAADCLTEISTAIAKRAYEIRPGGCARDGENWRLAESEVLQPLSCGVLKSGDKVEISLFRSALGTNGVDEVEVCVEPHRLIIAGKKRSSSELEQSAVIYRVLSLLDEIDPSSVRLRQQGPLVEIEMRKPDPAKVCTIANRAA